MADTDRNKINMYLKKKIYKCYLHDFHLSSLKLMEKKTNSTESSRTPPKWSHYWTLVAEGFFEDFVSLSE